MPLWYSCIRAAKVLNCSALDLWDRPDGAAWRDRGILAERADNLVQKRLTAKKRRRADIGLPDDED